MQINKEKLIKYISNNFKSSFMPQQDYNGNILKYIEINTKEDEEDAGRSFKAQCINGNYLLSVSTRQYCDEGLSNLAKQLKEKTRFTNVFEINEDIFNELLKFDRHTITPEIKEFYKQICDEE